MKKLTTLFAVAFSVACIHLIASAANLSDQDEKFLAGYGKAQAALVADNLDAAKAAAADLGDAGADLAKSASLKEARAAFESLSVRAQQLAAGQPGYHVFHCPMLKKDWVQSTEKVANPYGGKEMVSCGEIKS